MPTLLVSLYDLVKVYWTAVLGSSNRRVRKAYGSGNAMKRAIKLLVLIISVFCVATPFCSSETISLLSDARPKEQRSKGEIDFEVFRQISTGMTKEEVLSLAGPPAEVYESLNCEAAGRCLERWVYYYYDNWAAEISFWKRTGRVANINSYRRQ